MSLTKAVQQVFSPTGTLSRVVDRFEWRAEQSKMADRVTETLLGGEICIIEAPTGVGKSLGYLVPGAFWAREEQKVLLISTYTRNLQDQILRRDLPLLSRLSPHRLDVAVLKGRGNYLCRRRWEQARTDLAGTTDGEAFIRLLEGWVQITESGDLDDGPAIPRRFRGLVARVTSEARQCSTSECTQENGCFFKLSRRRAREAQVVLVNHSLLVLELLTGGVGLPPFDGLVIDEAHHLPHVAADALSVRISARSWRHALLGLGGQGEPGVTDRLRRIILAWGSREERTAQQPRLRELEGELGTLLDLSDRFFRDLKQDEAYPKSGGRSRYRLGVGAGGPFPASTYPLIEATDQLMEKHGGLLRDIRGKIEAAEPDTALHEIERGLESVRSGLAALVDLTGAEDPGTVYWLEDDPGEGAVLRSRPLDLSQRIGERLSSGRPLILTSATLAADASTRFFARSVGLPEGTAELILPSVFPIAEQVRFLAPKMIREPNDEGHDLDLSEAILRLAVAIPRKILVLFTAHTTLQRVYEQIRTPLEDRGIWVYAQDRAASRTALSRAFRDSDRAVLLGAASFWEGVDFPGEHLEILLMVRLPFPVPRDPFVEAYAEKLREEGIDPFDRYMLPEAIVRFRQGFGRLIRRRGDRGVFAVLDPRIVRRGYGARFVRALGVGIESVDSWDDLVEESRTWFTAGKEPTDEKEDR